MKTIRVWTITDYLKEEKKSGSLIFSSTFQSALNLFWGQWFRCLLSVVLKCVPPEERLI